MQTRFNTMSENIISKIDDMGSRIDEIENNINEVMEMCEEEEGAAADKAEEKQDS
ncbi:hypothetical protein FOA52_005757 [Chlamydomonas sp. UWO 241]|nr:hypothetical protein FOA52_005757 [Chlamydomonas sp. UWO 241]